MSGPAGRCDEGTPAGRQRRITEGDVIMSEASPEAGAVPTPGRAIGAARLAANKADSSEGTGPRTPAGREASRPNGPVHGPCAEVSILPGEDPKALQRRIDTWAAELG